MCDLCDRVCDLCNPATAPYDHAILYKFQTYEHAEGGPFLLPGVSSLVHRPHASQPSAHGLPTDLALGTLKANPDPDPDPDPDPKPNPTTHTQTVSTPHTSDGLNILAAGIASRYKTGPRLETYRHAYR